MAVLIIWVEVANAEDEAHELIVALQQSRAIRAGVPLPAEESGSVMMELTTI